MVCSLRLHVHGYNMSNNFTGRRTTPQGCMAAYVKLQLHGFTGNSNIRIRTVLICGTKQIYQLASIERYLKDKENEALGFEDTFTIEHARHNKWKFTIECTPVLPVKRNLKNQQLWRCNGWDRFQSKKPTKQKSTKS